jgi:hypothetical protein
MLDETREFRWPVRKLAGDYVRGIVGVVFAVLCAFLAPSGSWWQIVLILLLVLFVVFLSDVLIRHGTRIVVTSVGISRFRPIWGEDKIAWDEISGLDVRFYPFRRDRTAGWMTASIKGPRAKIALDDAMTGFEDVMDRAMLALERRGLGMNEATAANLASLGLGLRPKAVR